MGGFPAAKESQFAKVVSAWTYDDRLSYHPGGLSQRKKPAYLQTLTIMSGRDSGSLTHESVGCSISDGSISIYTCYFAWVTLLRSLFQVKVEYGALVGIINDDANRPLSVTVQNQLH